MSDTYRPREVEAQWRSRWEADPPNRVDLDAVRADQKFYNLVEFPYPSAEGLHVGHVYTYCGADTFGRYQRMRGKEVYQPIGFDSFGIHTENYALKIGERPDRLTAKTIANYRRQLARVGAAWEWGSEVVTSDPRYYRWTQWLFLRLFKAGLAYRAKAAVVWCPSCMTVLANEQLEGDRCERCGTVVTNREMEQWFLRITSFADALLEGLDRLDWPDAAKKAQREWIGRSAGVEIDFHIEGSNAVLSAFTTRADTIFGVTFLAVPSGHLASGSNAINPISGVHVPIIEADYVVSSYGTGVVMGVPAHDLRDRAFAVERGLPIRKVVEANEPTADGVLIDSGEFTGLDSVSARMRIRDELEARGAGRGATRYRLHDWLISRQRYWGPPIPVTYCDTCGIVPVPEDQLPVLLPETENFRPTGTGQSPLATLEDWVATTCPTCSGPARRETDVSDTFLDSSWYFLRYPSSEVDDRPW